MADPRLAVSFAEIGALYASFKSDGVSIVYNATVDNGADSDTIGHAVNLSAADTVQLAADGEAVLGKLIKVEADGICTVQIRGAMTLPGGNGASLTLGKKIVGALDGSSKKGHIREVATATAAELGLARGFIVDAGTTTAVELFLL